LAVKKFVPFVTDFPKPKPLPKPSTGGILQDTGLAGQRLGAGGLAHPQISNPVIGNYAGQQIYAPPGDLGSATINAGDWGNQGWATQPGRTYSPGPDYTQGLTDTITQQGWPQQEDKAKPGYYSTIFDDPLYQAALKNYLSRTQTGRNALRNQLQNAVIQSGYIPKFNDNPDLQGYADDLDQETINRAQGNQMSQANMLNNQENIARNDIAYRLAARGEGLIGPGAGTQTVASQNLQNQYAMTRNQQMGSLLDAIRGYITDYAGVGETAGQDLLTAAKDTASRLANAPGPAWDLTTATPESAVEYGIAPGAQGAVNWGGQQFMSRQGLSDFLNQFTKWGGITPERWAATHPAAWARLT